jgi:hypothetical protein
LINAVIGGPGHLNTAGRQKAANSLVASSAKSYGITQEAAMAAFLEAGDIVAKMDKLAGDIKKPYLLRDRAWAFSKAMENALQRHATVQGNLDGIDSSSRKTTGNTSALPGKDSVAPELYGRASELVTSQAEFGEASSVDVESAVGLMNRWSARSQADTDAATDVDDNTHKATHAAADTEARQELQKKVVGVEAGIDINEPTEVAPAPRHTQFAGGESASSSSQSKEVGSLLRPSRIRTGRKKTALASEKTARDSVSTFERESRKNGAPGMDLTGPWQSDSPERLSGEEQKIVEEMLVQARTGGSWPQGQYEGLSRAAKDVLTRKLFHMPPRSKAGR